MRSTFSNIAICSMIFLFGGCTSVRVTAPTAPVYTPFSNGKEMRGNVGISVLPTYIVTVADNAAKRPPDLNSTEPIAISTLVPIDAGIGITDRFDARVELDMFNAVTAVGLKYQVLGDLNENSKTGNTAGAIYVSYFNDTTTKSGTQSTTFGPGGYNWSAKLNRVGTHAGFSIGNQFNDNIFGFLGFARLWQTAYVSVDQAASDDGKDSGGSYSNVQRGSTQTTALGFTFGHKSHLTMTLEQTQIEWTNQSMRTDYGAGVIGEIVF